MFVSSIKMLENDRIDISEGTDIDKTNKSKELLREREQKVNTENYLKKKKILKESMEKNIS